MIGVVFVLRLAGVALVPGRWLVLGWILDLVLGLAELGVALAGARALVKGVREGGVLTGYERWIDKEEELGLPTPLAALARLELRFYRRLARAFGR